MTTWNALTGRISLFSAGAPAGPSLSALELFQRTWGSNPENFHSSGNALSPAIAQGKIGGLTASCFLQPLRVDFNLGPARASEDPAEVSLSVIEDTERLHSELARLIDFVGGDTGLLIPVNRIGIYLQFVVETHTIEAANKTLRGVIPPKYRPEITTEEDFSLQLNTPDSSRSVEGVRMNYITKWSVERFQVFNLSVAVGMPPPNIDPKLLPANQSRTFTAASVVYDMNNTPVSNSFRREEQHSLLRESLVAAEKFQREMGLDAGGF
jgi:hypothetical protein